MSNQITTVSENTSSQPSTLPFSTITSTTARPDDDSLILPLDDTFEVDITSGPVGSAGGFGGTGYNQRPLSTTSVDTYDQSAAADTTLLVA